MRNETIDKNSFYGSSGARTIKRWCFPFVDDPITVSKATEAHQMCIANSPTTSCLRLATTTTLLMMCDFCVCFTAPQCINFANARQ